MSCSIPWAGGLCLAVCFAGCVARDAAHPALAGGQSRERENAIDGYYLSACAHCGGMLGGKGDSVQRDYFGRDVRFCAESCAADFERDLGEGLGRLDRVMIQDQAPFYPLTTSLVSGEPIAVAGVDVVVGNRLFRLASGAERSQLVGNIGEYRAALDKAVIAAQEPTYGMPDKCPVQGDILASDSPIEIVVANRMVRVCCARCAGVVRRRPAQFLALVDYSNREAAARRAARTD